MRVQKRIDKRNALKWLEGDERMFAKMIAIFMKNIPLQVDQLKAFLDSDDNGATERVAHTIMGSSAMMGAHIMSEEARNIECFAIAGDMDSARLHFTRLVDEITTVMEELAADGGLHEHSGS